MQPRAQCAVLIYSHVVPWGWFWNEMYSLFCQLGKLWLVAWLLEALGSFLPVLQTLWKSRCKWKDGEFLKESSRGKLFTKNYFVFFKFYRKFCRSTELKLLLIFLQVPRDSSCIFYHCKAKWNCGFVERMVAKCPTSSTCEFRRYGNWMIITNII